MAGWCIPFLTSDCLECGISQYRMFLYSVFWSVIQASLYLSDRLWLHFPTVIPFVISKRLIHYLVENVKFNKKIAFLTKQTAPSVAGEVI